MAQAGLAQLDTTGDRPKTDLLGNSLHSVIALFHLAENTVNPVGTARRSLYLLCLKKNIKRELSQEKTRVPLPVMHVKQIQDFPYSEYGKHLIVGGTRAVYNILTAHKPTRSEAGAEYSNIRRLPFLLGANSPTRNKCETSSC